MMRIWFVAGLGILTALMAAVFSKRQSTGSGLLHQFVTGFWPGFLLSVFLFCALWETAAAAATVYHLLAMVTGMAAVILLEKRGWDAFAAWLLIGLAAGAQISAGHFGAISLTAAVSVIIINDTLLNKGTAAKLNILFASALLFFMGELAGYVGKLFLPEIKSVFSASAAAPSSIFVVAEYCRIKKKA